MLSSWKGRSAVSSKGCRVLVLSHCRGSLEALSETLKKKAESFWWSCNRISKSIVDISLFSRIDGTS
jgi:translation initiation factor IF-2